jgi:hypothetical protein
MWIFVPERDAATGAAVHFTLIGCKSDGGLNGQDIVHSWVKYFTQNV